MLTDEYDPLKGEMLQILDKDGNVDKILEPDIPDDLLIRAYKTMVLARTADEKAVRLQRQGKLGAYPPSKGQEASQLGPALAMGDEDWLVWAFRELTALMWRGVPIWRAYLYWMGNEEGSNYPEKCKSHAVGRTGFLTNTSRSRHLICIQAQKRSVCDGRVLRRWRDIRRRLQRRTELRRRVQDSDSVRMPKQSVCNLPTEKPPDRGENDRPKGLGIRISRHTGRW